MTVKQLKDRTCAEYVDVQAERYIEKLEAELRGAEGTIEDLLDEIDRLKDRLNNLQGY